jgi:hypothetical protein
MGEEVEEQSFRAVLGARQRVAAGVIGLGLGVGVPFALSVVLTATTGDPAFVIFPLPFLGAVWAIQGLAPAGVTLTRDGVRLERRWLQRQIPYAAVRDVDRTPRRVGGLLAFGANSLFGSHGLRWNPTTGLHYLFIANTAELVYLHTARGLIVLSPERPDEFMACLRQRIGRPAAAPRGRPDIRPASGEREEGA